MMMRDVLNGAATCAAILSTLALAGCGPSGDDDGCGERSLGAVFSSPNNFGAMFPPNDQADVTDNSRSPYEWTVLLRTDCSIPVTISKVCVVGSSGSADDAEAKQFLLEGPTPAEVMFQQDSAVCVTYSRKVPAGVDNVALLVESNAADYPTIVVPLCARVVENGAELPEFECASPVPFPEAGEAASVSCP